MIDEVDITRYKYYLKEYLNRYHNISDFRKAFRCLNPNHEDRHPSMYYSTKYNICKCFSCGKSYDIFDLIKIDYGLTNFREQYNKLAELFNEEYKQVNTEIILNDNYADGRDVSWIWDANFELISNFANDIYVSGKRAYDMALRLKYANIDTKLIHIEPDIKKAFELSIKSCNNNYELNILPTYTALLELKKIVN